MVMQMIRRIGEVGDSWHAIILLPRLSPLDKLSRERAVGLLNDGVSRL